MLHHLMEQQRYKHYLCLLCVLLQVDYILKIFDRDRLICECIKHENKMDREIYNKAIQAYINDSKKNITNLLDYAKRRNIHKKVRERIGVWL